MAKYEYAPGKQSGLGRHKDGTPWSFVLTLNQPDKEFSGGGTCFFDSKSSQSGVLYRPSEVGSVVLFSGRQFHEGLQSYFIPFLLLFIKSNFLVNNCCNEGVPVTSGVRYILTGFCSYYPSSRGVHNNDNDDGDAHAVFMSDYRAEFDGLAAAAGARTGDILRAVRLPPSSLPSFSSSNRLFYLDGHPFVSTVGMCTEELRSLVQTCVFPVDNGNGEWVKGGGIEIAIERLGERSQSSLAHYVMRNAEDVFAKGMFWSIDEAIGLES